MSTHRSSTFFFTFASLCSSVLAATIPLETGDLEMEVSPRASGSAIPTPRRRMLPLEITPTAGGDRYTRVQVSFFASAVVVQMFYIHVFHALHRELK